MADDLSSLSDAAGVAPEIFQPSPCAQRAPGPCAENRRQEPHAGAPLGRPCDRLGVSAAGRGGKAGGGSRCAPVCICASSSRGVTILARDLPSPLFGGAVCWRSLADRPRCRGWWRGALRGTRSPCCPGVVRIPRPCHGQGPWPSCDGASLPGVAPRRSCGRPCGSPGRAGGASAAAPAGATARGLCGERDLCDTCEGVKEEVALRKHAASA